MPNAGLLAAVVWALLFGLSLGFLFFYPLVLYSYHFWLG